MIGISFDEVLARLKSLPPDQLKSLAAEVQQATKEYSWVPNPGPQTEAAFCKADELFYGGQAGGGKQLDINTPIPTPDGFIPIGKIKVGDWVLSPNGFPVKVIAVSEPEFTDSYAVTFDTGETIYADPRHLWSTLTDKDRDKVRSSSVEWRSNRKKKRKSRAKGKSLKPWVSESITRLNQQRVYDMRPVEQTPKTTQEIRETITLAGDRTNHSIDLTRPIELPESDLIIEPYLFGLWLGDGYSGGGCVGMMDGDAQFCYSQVERPILSLHTQTKNRNIPFIIARFVDMQVDLRNIGVLGDKKIPDEYLRGSFNQRLALAQGLMDTDGTTTKTGQCEIALSKPDLLFDVQELFCSLGIKCSVTRKETACKPSYKLKFVSELPMFRLPRKLARQRMSDFRPTTKHRFIMSVEPAGKRTMRCIQVANPDGLYLVGNTFIATHNSSMITGLAVTQHERSLILRRFRSDAQKMAEAELLGKILDTRDGWNAQLLTWKNGKQLIEFGGCELETDKQKYKGLPHDLICVGPKTEILMADGSYKYAINVCVGDYVATLEGPRRVNRAFKVKNKNAVLVKFRNRNGDTFEQYQSDTHSLLTDLGWISYSSNLSACRFSHHFYSQSTECHISDKYSGSELQKYPVEQLSQLVSSFWIPRMGESNQAISDRLHLLETVFSLVRSNQGNYSSVFDDLRANIMLPVLSSALPVLSLPLSYLFDFLPFEPLFLHGTACDQFLSSLIDYLVGYLFSLRQYDGQPQKHGSLLTVSDRDQALFLQQDDAGHTIPTCSTNDDSLGNTPKHSRHKYMYPHPYGKGIRSTAANLSQNSFIFSPVGKMTLFDFEIEEVNHFITKGGIINKNCFDEIGDFTKSQYQFITIWNRSTTKGQRCRVICTGNPPTSAEGLWVIQHWAAWLDPNYPNPAEPGELRWYIRDEQTDEEIEVDGIGPHGYLPNGDPIYAKSRTFIPAKLADNPDLAESGEYARTLNQMPKELRDAYRDGIFKVNMEDAPMQVIPTSWVMEAQARWREQPPLGTHMNALGVDVAQGGGDKTVLSARYDAWFDRLLIVPGKETPGGSDIAGLVFSKRRDNAKVIIDVGGGWGADAYGHLLANGVDSLAYMGVKPSGRSAQGGMLKFANVRTEAYWKLREALNPDQPGGSQIALPPSQTLLADLTGPTYSVKGKHGGGILQMESKDDFKKRLGRSPDEGDAVVMAWYAGERQENVRGGYTYHTRTGPAKVNLGHANMKTHRR